MTPATSAVERYSILAVRHGITLGALYSASVGDFQLVLAAAAASFAPGRDYAEREVNAILRDWLEGAGAMLEVDHVELRRWLVDSGHLTRDGFGRAYARGSPAPEAAALAAALEGVDLGQVACDARARDAAAREQRKARWQQGKGSANA
jgi:hypothetical protein